MNLGRVMMVAGCIAVGASMVAPAAEAGGGATFKDAAGDATGLDPQPGSQQPAIESAPRPSDPELDLLTSSWAADAKTLTITTTVTKLGAPPVGIGTVFRFWFSYDKVPFQLIAQLPSGAASAAASTGLFMRARMTSSAELNCRDCKVVYDAKANTIKITASLVGLSAGMRQQKAALKPLKAGSKLTDLSVLGQRLAIAADRTVDVGRTITADVARGGPDSSVTI